jgi:CubicO group peptidase (beta-lactamase class C family)
VSKVTALKELLDEGLSSVLRSTGVPGISISASIDGESVDAHAGVASLTSGAPLSECSRFEMSCIMKLLISALAYREVARERLMPSTAICKYIPEFGDSASCVCVGHLMSHSSGFRGLDISESQTKWAYSWEKLKAHIAQHPLSFPPGKVFNYEHSEHVILGELLSRHFGRDVFEVLKEDVLVPIGIGSTVSVDDQSRLSHVVGQHVLSAASGEFVTSKLPAFGGFWRTSLPAMTICLRDVVRLGEWLMSDSSLCDAALLEPVIHLTPQVAASRESELIPESFGHLCAQYPDALAGHNGSTYGQTVALRMHKSTRTVVAVGVNAWVPRARDEAIKMVCELTGSISNGTSPPIRVVSPAYLDQIAGSFSLKQLRGTYAGSLGGLVKVTPTDSGLCMAIGASPSRQASISIERGSDDRYHITSRIPFSCGFSAHPDDKSPVCVLGVHAYRMIADGV